MRVCRSAVFLSLWLLLCCVCRAHGQASASPVAAPPPAYEADPKFVSAWADANKLKRGRQYEFALDGYKKANKIAGGSCLKCLDEVEELQFGLHHYKDAIGTAQLLITLHATPRDRSFDEGHLAAALLGQAGEKAKPEQLAAAHTLFQSALTDFPKNNTARWQDACLLVRMGKTEDAKQQFSQCATLASPKDPMRLRAAHFAENPELSLHKMAPAFEVTALDGTRFNLDDMGGKVVLIDFWATWCGPCNEELPNLRRIAHDFAEEPFVLISVSWDRNADQWKEFIEKHDMHWLQYRDADHKLSERFGIEAIPHYFTIDSDGVLTAEMLGSGNDVEGKLKKLIKRAREAQAQRSVAVVAQSGVN